MKIATICPTPELHRLDTCNKYHLVLAQQCDDPKYFAFYRDLGHTDGHYLILDNGADELGTGLRAPYLMALAAELNADEVVMPDVQQSGEATVAATREAARWLVEPEGRIAWSNAGCPQVQLVPQGRTLDEWLDCYHRLVDMRIFQGPVWPPSRPPVIGVAKNHETLFNGGVLSLVELVDAHHPIHLLGWPERLDAITEIEQVYPERVRSIDSARPIVYGLHGWELILGEDPPPYPGRMDDYFNLRVPDELIGFVQHNIEVMKLYARDHERAHA